MPVTVSIVEEHRHTRECLAELLSGHANVRYLGSFGSVEEAFHGLLEVPPDVVLMDMQLPGLSAIDAVARLKTRIPQLQVLMLTTYEHSELIFRFLCAGASGYVLKNTPLPELVQAIEQVHSGGAPMSMPVARRLMDHFREICRPNTEVDGLTSREQEILALLAKGRPDQEIGGTLGISLPMVRSHLRNIYEKLHVQCRT